ncbi:MAG TPA: hypothetical protein VIW21_05670 [Chthoniobacterales bacterium]
MLSRGRDQRGALTTFKSGECAPAEISSLDQPAVAARRLVGRRIDVWVLLLLGLLPLAAIVRLIAEYGVNVPWGDEWSLVPMFAKWHNHQLSFLDLFRQHNEHRIFFPKLIFLACAQWTQWNLKAEMFFSVFLACATSAGIYFLLQRTLPGPARKHLLLWALMNLLIFAPVQAENWLWGFQLQIFIPNLCLVGSLVVFNSALAEPAKFTGASLLAIVAMFSFGSGLLLWPTIALYLLLSGRRIGWLIAWAGVLLFAAAAYCVDYHPQPIRGPRTGRALDYFFYFAGFNGGALGRIPVEQGLFVAIVVGCLALLLYSASFVFFVRSSRAVMRVAAPWLALGAYPIFCAALAASTRVGWGPQQSLDSRYTSISTNLYVALIALVVMTSRFARELKPGSSFARAAAAVEIPFFAVMLTLYFAGWAEGLDHFNVLHRLESQGRADLQFCKVIQLPGYPRNDLMSGDSSALLQSADLLDQLHLLNPPLRRSAILPVGEDRPTRSMPEFGWCDQVTQKAPDVFEIGGWALLPATGQPAPRVVLAYRTGTNWIAFALSDVRKPPGNIFTEVKSGTYLGCGWRKVFARTDLPNGATTISAWALDPAAGEVYKLPGIFVLPAR